MKPQQVIVIALRLLALWLGIEALRVVPTFFLVTSDGAFGYVYMFLQLGITVVFALALWFFPSAIAEKVVPSQQTGFSPSAAPDTWLAMGCSLMGLWLLATTIPCLVLGIYTLNLPGAQNYSEAYRSTFYNLAEVVIAFWLILGGKGFRKLFWWAQHAGVNKAL